MRKRDESGVKLSLVQDLKKKTGNRDLEVLICCCQVGVSWVFSEVSFGIFLFQ